MAGSYRKPHRYKKKKPIFRKRFFWLAMLFLITCLGFFYLIYLSPFFQTEKIEIGREIVMAAPGIRMVSEETVERINSLVEEETDKKILFFKTKSIFLVNSGRLEKRILGDFPQIALIEIDKKFLSRTLSVSLSRKKGIALWWQEDNYFLLDKEGVIFERVPEVESRQIKIRDISSIKELQLGEKVIEKEKLEQILEIESKSTKNSKVSITEVSILSEGRLNAGTSEGWEIYFNLKGDLSWQITELSLVLEKQIPPEKREELEYIDLRFNRVFYK